MNISMYIMSGRTMHLPCARITHGAEQAAAPHRSSRSASLACGSRGQGCTDRLRGQGWQQGQLGRGQLWGRGQLQGREQLQWRGQLRGLLLWQPLAVPLPTRLPGSMHLVMSSVLRKVRTHTHEAAGVMAIYQGCILTFICL